MLTILKKEFKSYLRRTSGYVYIALSLMAAGIFVAAYNLYYLMPGIEYALPNTSLAFTLILPLFAMNLFSRDRQKKTDKLYYSLPLKGSQIALGKYGALLCFFAIQVAFLAVIPLLLNVWGTVNFASAYLALLCFLLFGASMIAMNVAIFAAFKSNILALSISYVSVIAEFFLYLAPKGAADGLWKSVAEVLRFLSPFSHLDNFLRGKLEIGSLVYFVVLTAFFLFLAVRNTEKKRVEFVCGKKSPETKTFSLSPVLAILLAVCTIASGTLISFIPRGIVSHDLTRDKKLSLEKSTKEFISSIEKDVTLYVINSDSSDYVLENMLELFDEGSEHITVKRGTDTDFAELLNTLGWDGSTLPAYTTVVQSADRTQVINYADLLYYEHPDYPDFGKMSEDTYLYYYQMLMSYAQQDASYMDMLNTFVYNVKMYMNAEQMISNCIEYVTADLIPQPYYVMGHGEADTASSNLGYALSSFNFVYEKLDLPSASTIPADANCLIINAPKNDLSDAETKLISDFLANGGAMILMTNDSNRAMTNLMSLVNAYGASAESGLICIDEVIPEDTENTEEGSAEEDSSAPDASAAAEEAEGNDKVEEDVDKSEGETEAEPYNKFLVTTTFDANHDSLFELSGYSSAVLNANNIAISKDLKSSTVITPIITTPAESYIDGVENSSGTKTVGVAIEDETANGTTEIIWFTGADAYDGDDIQYMSPYAVAYSMIWCGEEFTSSLAKVDPILLNEESLNISSSTRLIVVALIIVIIPAAVVIVGLILNKKRRPKKAIVKQVASPAEKKADTQTDDKKPDDSEKENTDNTEENN